MRKLRLHWIPGSAAMAPHAALAEIGADYELARVERDEEGRSPAAYVALNPSGKLISFAAFFIWPSSFLILIK